ncbi:hypothetical protein [Streptomyces sp. H27-D2]|uniref:hypothetical protein n=1 Tax=Streptomyces sp. H27-D2 TaxID=3046304 RepID=UPI002DB96A97|nr:hypothetical protein [Streptomyces sp. H27-D2]MEC4019701.1 hypothetical protein [Streptomyces sp. H27-D2]
MTSPSSGELDERLGALLWKLLDYGTVRPAADGPWDVVVTTAGATGLYLVEHMDAVQPGGCGPVIADPDECVLLWLVPPGTSRRWMSGHGMCFAGSAKSDLPPSERRWPPGHYWVRGFRDGHFVDADLLDRTLTALSPGLPLSAPQEVQW